MEDVRYIPFVAHYEKLLVWEKAHALMISTHQAAKGMRRVYEKSLRSQMTRAAESVVTNIVEGKGKSNDVEFARFLRISLGSAHELEYHFIAARDVEAMMATDAASLIAQAVEVRRMLYGLLKRLEGDK